MDKNMKDIADKKELGKERNRVLALVNVFETCELSHYQDLMREMLSSSKTLTVELELNECTAILQAHDYGIDRVTPDAARQLNTVMTKLKEKIWP